MIRIQRLVCVSEQTESHFTRAEPHEVHSRVAGKVLSPHRGESQLCWVRNEGYFLGSAAEWAALYRRGRKAAATQQLSLLSPRMSVSPTVLPLTQPWGEWERACGCESHQSQRGQTAPVLSQVSKSPAKNLPKQYCSAS